MRLLPSTLFSIPATTAAFVLVSLATRASAYFVITQPNTNTQWLPDTPNLITWTKGAHDGVVMFDVEMARMNSDGLNLIAKNVPSAPNALNMLLTQVPAGSDYFLIFMNSTNGQMYATSTQFTVLAPSATPSPAPPAPTGGGVATVTVSGTPYPTRAFATTFPALLSAARRSRGAWGMWEGFLGGGAVGVGMVVLGVLGGGLAVGW